jgi:hypothetical protein
VNGQLRFVGVVGVEYFTMMLQTFIATVLAFVGDEFHKLVFAGFFE